MKTAKVIYIRVGCWWAVPWSNPSRICWAMSRTAPGPCGIKTAEDLEDAPISFMVSKYWVTRTMSITSLAVVPGTLTENPITLSLRPSTIACLCLATPKPAKYLDSASPSALLIWIIFSASAFSLAATLNLAAAKIMFLVSTNITTRKKVSSWKLRASMLLMQEKFRDQYGARWK